jgi:hypothetical protein
VPEAFRCVPDGLIVPLADVMLVRLLGKGGFGDAFLAVVRGRGARVVKVSSGRTALPRVRVHPARIAPWQAG